MKRVFTSAFMAITGLALICSCIVYSDLSPVSLIATTQRSDGSSINWKLNRVSKAAPLPVLLIAQGSGCAPARSNTNLGLLEGLLSDFAVLTIEKYGVDPTTVPEDPMNGCSSEYYANHTVTRRVEDAKLVLRDLRSRALWDGRLVIFGGSEGGAVVSILSHELEDVDAVVVFSTGTGLTMAEFMPMVVPPDVASQLPNVFSQARSNPRSSNIFGGNSLKWWADILDRRLSEDLLKSAVPVLLIHGENDRHAPVAAARATRDAFVGSGQTNRFTYWELPHRDHLMRDETGKSHLREAFKEIADWVRTQIDTEHLETRL